MLNVMSTPKGLEEMSAMAEKARLATVEAGQGWVAAMAASARAAVEGSKEMFVHSEALRSRTNDTMTTALQQLTSCRSGKDFVDAQIAMTQAMLTRASEQGNALIAAGTRAVEGVARPIYDHAVSVLSRKS